MAAVPYKLIRTRRKTVALYVRADATTEVRAPLKMPQADIDRFVAAKADWLREKLALVEARRAKQASFRIEYGGALLLRGIEVPIRAYDGKTAEYDGEAVLMPANLTPEELKRRAVELYKALARVELAERTRVFAARFGVSPESVRVNGAKTRWGSCSGKRRINFSWHVMMADDALIDYVVVHELAHLLEMNHSERFWSLIAGILPDYESRKKRLRELQTRLGGEKWDEG
jgi:predicted metal-dependent hydrolase